MNLLYLLPKRKVIYMIASWYTDETYCPIPVKYGNNRTAGFLQIQTRSSDVTPE